MLDILDFIDSRDIREYNRDTHFSPIEKAVLIYLSRGTTVEQKLSAWHELLETYSDEDFGRERAFCSCTNKEALAHTVEAYERALSDRYDTEGRVFEATFYESEFPDSLSRGVFSGYDKAFEYIRKAKQEYLDDEELKEVAVKAEIKIKVLDKNPLWDTAFCFDTDLRMTEIVTESAELCDFFVYVPLPFKKGDILRTTDRKYYGVLSETPDKKHFKRAIEGGDVTDMCVTLDEFYEDEGKWVFGWDHYDYLKLELCPDDELPEDKTIFFYLRDVYRGKMTAGELLYLYSHYGERAYTELYGEDKE